MKKWVKNEKLQRRKCKKMNKKILIGTLAIVLIAVIGSVMYISNGSSVKENAVIEYLENMGYSQSQIQSVQAKYSSADNLTQTK